MLKARSDVCLFFDIFSCEAGNGGCLLADFSGEPIGATPTAVSALQLRSKVSMSSVMDLFGSCKTLESTGGQTFCCLLFLFTNLRDDGIDAMLQTQNFDPVRSLDRTPLLQKNHVRREH